MKTGGSIHRPRPRSLRSGAFFILAVGAFLLWPVGLSGQEPDTVPAPPPERLPPRLAPERPDTVPRVLPRDTLSTETVPTDTVPADTLGPPPPELPEIDPIGPAGWARGVWEWDRLALLRLSDLSLIQLLERIPGVVPVRADVVNQAESAVVFGAAAGAIRYVVDGFALDPLSGPTFDPSRLPLLALDRVRVERRVTGATVYLETAAPDHPRPRTRVEAGTGDMGINLFRGVFLGPRVFGGPMALGFERLASSGAVRAGSNHLAGWVKWSWIQDSSGVQIEYRQSDMDRTGVGSGLSGARRDWVVRARTARGPVTGEIYAGASRVEDDRGDVVIREGTPQGGLRLRGQLAGPVPLEGLTALRFRDHPRLPFAELELGIRTLPLPLLTLEGEVVRGWWSEGSGSGRWTGRAQVGPLVGLTAFTELFGGAPLLDDALTHRLVSPDSAPLRLTRSGIRAGASLEYRSMAVTGAAIRTSADEAAGLGLPAESGFLRSGGGDATGFEVMARIPTPWDPLAIEGWYVGMESPADWLYIPDHHWRVALVYHHLPLPSGNLELFTRVEHEFRGRMTAPALDPASGEPGSEQPSLRTRVGAYRATNLELTIRILTVRAFLRWENFTNRFNQRDLPGFTLPGQHILYGVKWEFLN